MRNIKLTIQYDGTNYSGWQSQKNSIAIQDLVARALKKLLGESIKVTGASRTDAGVHAAGQVANFKSGTKLTLLNIKEGLNRYLPNDIVVIKIQSVDMDFHSQYCAKSKLYRYTIYTNNTVTPFKRNYTVKTKFKLDLSKMRKEARALLGRHDFSSFQSTNSERQSTIRRIYRLDVVKKGRFIYFYIEADGFLYNMVRTIVGTLVNAGRGRLKEGSLKKIIKAKTRSAAGPTMPGKGLCLMKVRY